MSHSLSSNQVSVQHVSRKFCIGDSKYSIDQIRSVHLIETEPLRWVSLLCLVTGLFFSTRESGLFAVGAMLLISGIGLGIFAKAEYAILLDLPGGRSKVLVSEDRLYLQKILQTLEAAMEQADNAEMDVESDDDPQDLSFHLFPTPTMHSH